MPALRIDPIAENDLPAVAEYVHQFEKRLKMQELGYVPPTVRSAKELLDWYRWQTVTNPNRQHELGFQLRSETGQLLGVHLVAGFRFRRQAEQLLGLASCSFFVDEAVRLHAFYLFKRFLSMPGANFYFANSCNLHSGQLWAKCGGKEVPNTNCDWLAPLRGKPLVREALLLRGRKNIAGPISLVGAPLGYLWRFQRRKTATLTVRPTDDWQFVAEVSERYRNPNCISPEVNLEYLRWMYVEGAAIEQKRIFRFNDRAGNSGWFSVLIKQSGVDGNVRLAWLLDWAIPPAPFDFSTVVRAAIDQLSHECDLLAFRLRPDTPQLPRVGTLKKFQHPGPKGYVIPAVRSEQGLENLIVMSRADAV